MRALVFGLGESGRGATSLLKHLGYEVMGVDQALSGKQKLGIKCFPTMALLPHFDFDLIILSPGICPTHPLVIKGRERGIEVIGEVELALRHLHNPCMGITGTNGKTTLSFLIAHLLNRSGKRARVLGNSGESLAGSLCDLKPDEIVIVELSSFQLETAQTRVLDIGVITSIAPDHLDRYPSFEAYKQVKGRIAHLIRPAGSLVMPGEVREMIRDAPSDVLYEVVEPDSYLQLTTEEEYWEKIDPGKTMLAFAVCKRWNIPWEKVKKEAPSFVPPPHRLEYLGKIDAVTYWNDSKGTNLHALLFALRHMKGPVLLIAGGVDKASAFCDWKAPLKGKVKKVFAIGRAAPLIAEALKEVCPVEILEKLDQATLKAREEGCRGDNILLSPGCASFDQFANFEERGNSFRALFQRLRRKG